MDVVSILALIITVLAVLGFFSLIFFLDRQESKLRKIGKSGEQEVARILGELSLDYEVINDLLLPRGRGYVQIDHVVICAVGIIVIETKNYSGTIYGDDSMSEWEQSIGKKRRRFLSPVEQNEKHLACLRGYFGDRIPLYSVVAFSNRARIYAWSDKAMLCSFRRLISLVEGLKISSASTMTASEVYNTKLRLLFLNDASESAKRAHRSGVKYAREKSENK